VRSAAEGFGFPPFFFAPTLSRVSSFQPLVKAHFSMRARLAIDEAENCTGMISICWNKSQAGKVSAGKKKAKTRGETRLRSGTRRRTAQFPES
jgi:hypothetical protein